MVLEIKKDSKYAEANIAVVGVTKTFYGRPQIILVDSDEGRDSRLKFPGSRFRSTREGETLEDVAATRFEEQTGLTVAKNLGLRVVIPTRNRNDGQWAFRNIVFVYVESDRQTPTDGRRVFLANPGQGISGIDEVYELGHSERKAALQWVAPENRAIAEATRDVLYNFDWERIETSFYRRIPCVSVEPQTSSPGALGCSLAVATTILLWRESVDSPQKIILLKRRGDKYPGYVGGKIETPESNSDNLDPISCCAQESAEEFGFPIIPKALVCCAHTPANMPSQNHHNGIITYAFVAEPTNPRRVKEALANPTQFLEGKMEAYVVETLDQHKDRIRRGEMRMPDNIPIGYEFFERSPAERVNLCHIVSTGID